MKKTLLILATILLMAGCVNINEQPLQEATQTPSLIEKQQPEADKKPIHGGSIKMSMRQPKTLNPLLNTDNSVDNILKLLFEPLVVLDNNHKPLPNIIQSMEMSQDAASVDIILRDDIVWSDGQKITADDIVFSVDTIKNNPDTVYGAYGEIIASCQKLNSSSVKITYIKPVGYINSLLCFPIIPKHYYQNEKDPGSKKNMSPIGNGLYNFVSYTNPKEMKLTASNTTFKPKPYIQEITAIVTSDSETDLHAFVQGVTDVLAADVADWVKFRGDKTAEITPLQTGYFEFIGFNCKTSVFADAEIRRAVAYAIDTQDIIKNIYAGNAALSTTPINPFSWAHETSVTQRVYDMNLAKSLLSSTVLANGQSISILVNSENTERIKVAEQIMTNLTELGINAEIEELPFSDYRSRLNAKKYDIFVGGFDINPMADLSFAFHSKNADQNYFGYASEEMDRLLNEVLTAPNEAAQRTALVSIQQLFGVDYPCIGIAYKQFALLTDKKIKGAKNPAINNYSNNINMWYVLDAE